MSPYKVFKLSRKMKNFKVLTFIILFMIAVIIYFTGRFSALEVLVSTKDSTETMQVSIETESAVSDIQKVSMTINESTQENTSKEYTDSSQVTVSNEPIKSEEVTINEETTQNKLSENDYYISEIPLEKDLQKYTYELCEEKQISYELILAVMYYESRFDAEALSYNDNGSYDSGIMQINSCNIETLRQNYGITDLSNPYDNIYAGVNIIAERIQYLGENDGLMAYNMGLGGYYSAVKNGVYQTKYSSKILRKKEEIEEMPHGV